MPDALPLSNMKNAIDAKMIGCRTLTSTKNSECVSAFRWKSQPMRKRRARTLRASQRFHSKTAIRQPSSVHELCVPPS